MSTDSFRDLEVSEINDGTIIVIEDAHLRSQEDNSLSHTYKIDELRKLRSKANKRNILFMPDQDSWEETLEYYSKENIRGFLKMFDINEALIDGTFWSMEELPGRNISEIPHPTIQDSLKLLGKRMENDPRISFLHLNHSNPVNDIGSKQRKLVEENGWRVSEIGDVLKL